jgi:hypothetical protein
VLFLNGIGAVSELSVMDKPFLSTKLYRGAQVCVSLLNVNVAVHLYVRSEALRSVLLQTVSFRF